jgi:hypothetical protein
MQVKSYFNLKHRITTAAYTTFFFKLDTHSNFSGAVQCLAGFWRTCICERNMSVRSRLICFEIFTTISCALLRLDKLDVKLPESCLCRRRKKPIRCNLKSHHGAISHSINISRSHASVCIFKSTAISGKTTYAGTWKHRDNVMDVKQIALRCRHPEALKIFFSLAFHNRENFHSRNSFLLTRHFRARLRLTRSVCAHISGDLQVYSRLSPLYHDEEKRILN